MPGYQTTGSITALYQGDSIMFWNGENPAVGSSSLQAALGPAIGTTGQSGSVQIVFAGAPGAFEIDVQTSDTDVASDYVSKTQITTVDSNNVARAEISPLVAKFWRLSLVSLTNAVAITATGTIG